MEEFDELIAITDKLMGPQGCPWDREQTFETIRSSVLEEVHELIEAINLKDKDKILEELGDLVFNALFFCKLGEKEKLFQTEEVLKHISEKLIRRHPHVFGDAQIETSDELLEQWEKIKKREKPEERKSELDGIPGNLPTLSKAQKMIKKIKKTPFQFELSTVNHPEEVIGQKLLEIVSIAQEQKIDAELALMKVLNQLERKFREWE